MKRVILFSAIALVAGAILLRLMQHDAGYLLIVAGGKTIEMRLGFALLLLTLSVLALWLARRGWRLFTGGWRAVLGSRGRRAARYNQQGLLEFLAGDWQRAQKHLHKAARLSQEPVPQYLAAARCAAELGRNEHAQQLLQQAEMHAPADSLPILLTRARLQLQAGSFDACVATLHQAKSLSGKHPATLDLLQQAYCAKGDWRHLEVLLPALKQAKVLPETRWLALEAQVYYQQQCQLADRFEQVEGTRPTLEEVHALWQRLPKTLKSEERFVSRQAHLLMALQAYAEVETLLHTTLTRYWSETLVALYGAVPAPDPQKQLRRAEKWLTGHDHSAQLHLALGRICLRNQLWGQAKDHLHTSIQIHPSPAAYAELGQVLARLGEHRESALSYQQGLLLSNGGTAGLSGSTDQSEEAIGRSDTQ